MNIISKFTSMKSPCLYIKVDPVYQRWCLCTCMDGSVYLIDLYSCLQSSNPLQSLWEYDTWKQHVKYVIMGKWSKDSKYFFNCFT